MDNNKTKQKLRVFLLIFSILFGLIAIAALYFYVDFFAAIIFVLFSFPSIIGGVIGGLIGIIVLENYGNNQNNISRSAPFWLLLGSILGFDICFSMTILFFTVVGYAFIFGLEIIPLILGLLFLASNLLSLLTLALIPASCVAFIAVNTEKINNNFTRPLGWITNFDGRLVVGITIITLSSCYLTAALTMFPDKYILAHSEYTSSYDEASWRKLPEPPSKIQRLVAAFPFEVYAETTSGEILGCKRPSKFDIDCWYEIDRVPQETTDYSCTELDNRFFSTDKPTIEFGLPNNISVAQFINVMYCGYTGRDRSTVEFQYILTTEGDVWQWGFDQFGMSNTSGLQRIRHTAYMLGMLGSILIWVTATFLFWKFVVNRNVSRNIQHDT